jgi:MFS family permease
MEISVRDLWTVLHGMGFGALFMLAFTGAIAEMSRMSAPGSPVVPGPKNQMMLRCYLIGMVGLAWLTVFSGAYIVYPWYRAIPPAGTIDLAGYPQKLLISSMDTKGWHDFGMEWKEHVAWIAPIAMTMVAYVFAKYGPNLAKHRDLRKAALIFTLAAFVATGVAGAFGAFINKYAPIRGGETIHLMKGE